jgi:hypothetical protein
MVQNFTFFADRLGATKIRSVKSAKTLSYMQSIDVERVQTLKPRKFLLKG